MKNWLYLEQDIMNEEIEDSEEKITSYDFMDLLIEDIMGDEYDTSKPFIDSYPSLFLHGACDSFATVLKEMFGYEFRVLYPTNFFKYDLDWIIHAYCVYTNAEGHKFYIDVRGITDDKKLFFAEFKSDIKRAGNKTKEKSFKSYEEFCAFFGFDENFLEAKEDMEYARKIIGNKYIKPYYEIDELISTCA